MECQDINGWFKYKQKLKSTKNINENNDMEIVRPLELLQHI